MPEFTNDLTHDDLALLLLLAEKRSLTRSAMTLAWSTPKASLRLNHARALIGDELFVRSGNSLVPTKRMEALVPTMRRALEALEGIFAEERFSPLEIDRTIIFEMVDNAAAVLLAPALPALAERAPKLKIRIRPAAGLTLENLRDGTTNLAFGFDIDRELPGDIQSATLFKSRHVAVMRRGHPLLNHPSVKAGIPVGAKVLAPYPYISISMPQWRSLRNIDLAWRAENPSPVPISSQCPICSRSQMPMRCCPEKAQNSCLHTCRSPFWKRIRPTFEAGTRRSSGTGATMPTLRCSGCARKSAFGSKNTRP